MFFCKNFQCKNILVMHKKNQSSFLQDKKDKHITNTKEK